MYSYSRMAERRSVDLLGRVHDAGGAGLVEVSVGNLSRGGCVNGPSAWSWSVEPSVGESVFKSVCRSVSSLIR